MSPEERTTVLRSIGELLNVAARLKRVERDYMIDPDAVADIIDTAERLAEIADGSALFEQLAPLAREGLP